MFTSEVPPYPAQEVIAVRPLVHVIQNRVLGADRGLPPCGYVGGVEAYLDHVSRAHASALGHAVDQRLIEIEDQRLQLVWLWGFYVDV